MGKMDIGCNHDSILGYMHKDMVHMYAAVQSLEKVSSQLADAEYMRRRKLKQAAIIRAGNEVAKINTFGLHTYRQTDSVKVGTAFAPMLADRTRFETMLKDLRKRIYKNPAVVKIMAGIKGKIENLRIKQLPRALTQV